MPENSISQSIQAAIAGVCAAGAVVTALFTRFQTRGAFKDAQKSHDKLDVVRDELQETKLDAIHKDVEEMKYLLRKVANKVFE